MAATMRTDLGKVRELNEDAAWFDDERGIYAVADGMGGHLAGEVASAMAMDAVRAMAVAVDSPSLKHLRTMTFKANRSIIKTANENAACQGMGTTLSVMWRAGHFMYIAHVGDSRIYRMRNGMLEQVTQDHSLVEELVRAGLLTKAEARVHPRRNIITRALGTERDAEPDLLAAGTNTGDLWLLCTDGLTGMLDDTTISGVLMATHDLEAAADELLGRALAAGGIDNITFILLREEDTSWNRG